MLTDLRKSPNARLYGLAYEDVEWMEGFYKERFETCAYSMVPHLQKMFESKEISHVLENFRIAAGEEEGDFDGTVFGDGDFYKWMEAAVYTAVRTDNHKLLNRLEEYIDLFGRAQQPDGYLSTKQIIGEKRGTASRLADINEFEVYNFGHLFTSACLYKRLTGKDNFLKIAEKAAGYLKGLYEEARKTGNAQTAVCPSHYMGLAELYRTTGNREYLTLLKTAIELRDSVKEGLDDNQDKLPLLSHDKIIGHAVRANYLYAGVADLCMEEENKELQEVLHKVWNSLVSSKLYITGGCGALYNGASPYGNFFAHQLVHQAYGYEYQLPNVTAYNETCASVGGVYWAWRMLCMEKKADYADVLERMLLNVNLAGTSMDGKKFFYENMLRRAKKLPYALIWGQERAEYILSYCCPPNLARLMAQMSEYTYACDGENIYTVLYGASRAQICIEDSTQTRAKFDLVQETAYPYDGRISFHFEKVEKNGSFTLHLRIPAWAESGSILVKSAQETLRSVKLTGKDAASYVAVQIDHPDNTQVQLVLDMESRLTCAHPLVEETVNQVAVERGPLVYCMEGMDCGEETLDDIYIPSNLKLVPEEMELEGRKVISLKGDFKKKRTWTEDKAEEERNPMHALYRRYDDSGYDDVKARMIPYFAWANRGMDEMRIWFPVVSNR